MLKLKLKKITKVVYGVTKNVDKNIKPHNSKQP